MLERRQVTRYVQSSPGEPVLNEGHSRSGVEIGHDGGNVRLYGRFGGPSVDIRQPLDRPLGEPAVYAEDNRRRGGEAKKVPLPSSRGR